MTTNVHPYNEMAFIDALVSRGKKFEMMAYPMRKHGMMIRPRRCICTR
jgi:dipeptidyl aminopeptidase/acylaminoacyl peptidase